MTIDVSDNNPRINYSIAEGVTQTVFSVPFEFFEDSNVYIYVDGVLKTEGLDYTLTGGDGSTGTLTFVTATPPDIQQVTGAAGGTVVTLVRHVSLERVTDFVAGQDINRAALNEQLDTIVAQIADLDDRVDRTIHLNDSEVAPSMLLTDDRKGRVMAFNSSTGAVEAGPLSNDIATIADNIAEILAADDEAAAAAASATAAATSASAASTSATAAQTAQTAAELAYANAETAETNAETAETNAAASAAAALASETAAAASEAGVDADRVAAQAAAAAAAASETAAATSETNAATSETNAATSATSASDSESFAAGYAANAGSSATAAAASETAAASSAFLAAGESAEATTQASNAATSATAASASATAAATSETNAASSASSASASADAALAALDNFDDRYLGQKTSDPTLDNDGDALIAGALYFNTTDDVMKVYEGSVWVAAYASLSGALLATNNLSDVLNAAAARTNLGLGTAATTASTDYATAAQGALADSAIQTGDSPSFVSVTVSGTVDGRDIAADGSKLDGIEATADVTDAGNVNPLVDAHLNTYSATTGEYLSWTGSDYDWVAVSGYTDADVDTHLNTGTASSGEILSWTGTDYDWIAAGGGSALELYAENPSSPTAPTATSPNGLAIGSGAIAGGAAASVAIGEGASASANEALAIGKDASGASRFTVAVGKNAYSGSFYCTAVGYNSYAAGASNATALTNSRASGADSFAAAIANNTSSYGATGSNSVAIGNLAKASGNYSTAIGDTAQATGLNSVCIGDAVASGRGAIVIDGEGSSTHSGSRGVSIGYSSTGTADYSVVLGFSADDQGVKSRFAFSGSSFNNDGDSQQGMFPLRLATTDATPAALTTDGGAASTNNQVILPNNSAYAFHGTIVARQQASQGTACAAWKIEGLIRREGSAGTTVLVNSATTVLDNTPAWGMALSADTTNGGLKIEVTGAASTNIRWVATINTSEVTY